MPPDIIPVDYDPFSDAANAFPSFRAPASDLPQPLFNDFPVNQGFKPFNKLFGTGGETRHVLWPEQMVRRGLDVVHGASQGENQLESVIGVPGAQPAGSQDATYEPNMLGRALGMTEPWRAPSSESGIAKVQDLSGLMAGGPLIERPGTATLGSGAMRTGSDKFYPLEQSGSWFAKGGNSELKVGPFASKAEVDAYIASKGGEGPSSPPFYSAVEAAVRDASQPSMSPEQWRGYLSNRPGVKAEELDWVGLPEGKKVTKQEMLDHVQEHGVQVKEVEKRGIADMDEETASDVAYRELMRDDPPGPNESHESWLRRNTDRLDDRKWELLESEGQGGPKFGPDSAPNLSLPGGDNYREKLFMLPEKPNMSGFTIARDGKPVNATYASRQDALRAIREVGFGREHHYEAVPETRPEYLNKAGNPDTYRSGHWDEPNVLAHVRMNDREIPNPATRSRDDPAAVEALRKIIASGESTGPGGIDRALRSGAITPEDAKVLHEIRDGTLKTLHLEELQSDWHQAGRKQGYKADHNASLQKLIDAEKRSNIESQRGRDTEAATQAFLKYQEENQRHLKEWPAGSGVPDAPFKTTWPDLVLKRMIRDAAEGGYDAISWTPGEAQAARYDLSKHYDTIGATKRSDGTYMINGKQVNGSGRFARLADHVAEDKLADHVGKDLAEKIVKDGGGKYSGLDLKVGGEGMKGFYDKILVDKANALAKKFGGKVEYKEIGNDLVTTESTTPTGLTLFQTRNTDGMLVHEAYTPEGVAKYKEEHGTHKVPVLRLTPQLRDTALRKGFPLFSAGVLFPLEPVDHDPFKEQVP